MLWTAISHKTERKHLPYDTATVMLYLLHWCCIQNSTTQSVMEQTVNETKSTYITLNIKQGNNPAISLTNVLCYLLHVFPNNTM